MNLWHSFVIFFSALLITGVLIACQAEKQKGTTLDQLAPMNADEKAIYSILGTLQESISASEWDKWLALYSDDAVLTSGNKKLNKQQMRTEVKGISYKITNMAVLDKNIEEDQASVSVSMDGNGKKHYETYKLRKMDGEWLIVAETNP